ncbi:MAG: hypothetical protein V1792_09820 [Pseudomonadota bacterium]
MFSNNLPILTELFETEQKLREKISVHNVDKFPSSKASRLGDESA